MERVRPSQPDLHCPFCREALEGDEAVSCDRCAVGYHASCAVELGHGRCPTLGCGQSFGVSEKGDYLPPTRFDRAVDWIKARPLPFALAAGLGNGWLCWVLYGELSAVLWGGLLIAVGTYVFLDARPRR